MIPISRLKGGGELKLSLPTNRLRLPLFILLLCVVACSHTGSTCCNYNQIFRGQWDDYYLRALFCIEQANFQQALSDFQASLERRPPSRQYDRRMVRTYGMHYLDYFPNRETGFIFYLQHQYEKAKKYLNRSIQSEPSAKAYYYLNQVQKKLQTSKSQPVLAMIEPCIITPDHCEIWQSESNLFIRGTVHDTQLIEEITIQGCPFLFDDGTNRIHFSKRLVFEEGKHDIRIQAKNICGSAVETQIILHVDQTGPSISIEKSAQPEMINIKALDDSGQLALLINHKQIQSVNQNALNHSIKWPSEKSEIVVCVNDRCKNQTCATVSHSQLFQTPEITGLIAENKAIALSDADFSKTYQLTDHFMIDFDQQDPMTVFEPQISISGKISSIRPIVSVMINDTQLPIQAGKNIYFSRNIHLSEGQNFIYVLAKTISGHCQRKTIQVYRKLASVLKRENRYGLSMYPFNVNGQEQGRWAGNFFGLTNDAMKKSFEMAESFEMNFLKVLNEKQRFRINYRGQSVSGSQPYQGSLLGDAYVSKFGLEISARIVDNQTTAVLGIKDVYRENKGSIAIQAMARELSEKIHQSFPMIQGKIITKIEDGYQFECKSPLPKVSWPILVYKKQSDSDTIITGNGNITPGNYSNRQGMIVMDDGDAQCGDWVISR